MVFRLVVFSLLFGFSGFAVFAQRVPWTVSRIQGSPEPPKPYHVERVYPQLQFNNPVEIMPLADTGRMMLLEVSGKLYTFEDDAECAQADLALDLRPLIEDYRNAFAFGIHPDFANNRQIFVVYAGNPVARPDGTRLSRFVLSEDSPPVVDPASEEILLTWPSGGHNGCAIRFDSQGMLYFSTGDGARPYPPDEYDVSQDLSDLRSTICRIDVDRREGDKAYAIPSDNPFIDTPGARPEIWAYGFRNPWRFTIDQTDDRLFCGDVGWELWELVFDVKRGGNYGWSIYEGPQPIRSDIQPGPTPIQKPLVAYPHAVGQSITGGVVYHGDQHEDLEGAYLYGDYVTGLLWGVRSEKDQVTWNPVLAETGLRIITMAENRDREVLIVDYDGGIYRLVENPKADEPTDFPRKLSETGLYSSTATMEPAAGVIPYQINARSWRGGAASDFVLGIPGTGTIKINQRQRNWQYPEGTVFANTISMPIEQPGNAQDGSARWTRVETQILHFDGIDWKPYSFVWNDEQTDADLVAEEGITRQFGRSESNQWSIHHRAQCRACHSRQNGGAVGFTLENLPSRSVDEFIEMEVLDRRAPAGWNVTSMVDPADPTANLQQRARSYLTANCAHCHRRGGGGTVPLDLTYFIPLEEINAIDVAPMQGSFGIADPKVICSGDPSRSILFYRMATSGTGHMPKLWSRDNDAAGLQLIHDWIVSLDAGQSKLAGDLVAPESALGDTRNSLRLFSRMLSADSDDPEATKLAALAVKQDNPITAAIFERFLPPEQRRQRLGANIDAAKILSMQGDARRGRELFFGTGQGQCNLCHRLQGGGQSVGPDLDGVAKKRTREQILESILEPSKVIEPQFRSLLVLTDDGTIVTGLKIAENEAEIVVRAANGKDKRISKDTIESTRIQTESLMPTGLAAEMTAAELVDLLEFLSSLR